MENNQEKPIVNKREAILLMVTGIIAVTGLMISSYQSQEKIKDLQDRVEELEKRVYPVRFH